MKKPLFSLLLALCLATLPATGRAAVSSPEALQAATDFLALYDQKDWIGCWQSASEEFRLNQPLEQWSDAAERNLQLLGPALVRSLVKTTSLRRFPDFPDGNYQAMVFQVQTTRKQKASELVILSHKDGRWQVASYRRR